MENHKISESSNEYIVEEIDILQTVGFEEPIRIERADLKGYKSKTVTSILKNNFTLEVFYVLLFLWLEIVFHVSRFGITGDNLLIKLSFAVLFGYITGAVVDLLPKIAARIITIPLSLVFTVYFMVQIIYSSVFATFLSVTGSIGMTNQAFDFKDVIWKAIRGEWLVLLLLILPFVFYCVFGFIHIASKKRTWKKYGIQVLVAGALFFATYVCVFFDDAKDYSARELHQTYTSVDLAVAKLGVWDSLYLDLRTYAKETLHIKEQEISFVTEEVAEVDDIVFEKPPEFASISSRKEEEEELVFDTSPNILELDLDALIANETNSNIRSIHEYVKSVTPTNKNAYTGIFEGYNVIFVVAEGFSGYMVDPKLTPTLYRLSHEGFVFKHYYTPLWYGSTVGGEYADLTGLMPKNGSYLSMEKIGKNKNDMMFTLGNQLSKQGYKTMGFHNNSYRYYDRHISHPNLGYEWIGIGNGLEAERKGGTQLWPQSDLKMIEDTFDLYKDEEPFHTYYLTVSGHVMYNFGGNAMAARHADFVQDLPYSETTKAYIACQHELELAMTALVQKLEEEKLADHTVIVLTADHVPYDDKEVCDELAGHGLDGTFDWYKNTLIIWSGSMEKPVTVAKYCSSLDILPTVSNLLGLPYDSRMLVGQDILSDSEGFVIFNDRSFITDKCSYNANTGEIKSMDGSKIDEAYVQNKIAQVKNKFNMAESICNFDYYRYIDAALEATKKAKEEEALAEDTN